MPIAISNGVATVCIIIFDPPLYLSRAVKKKDFGIVRFYKEWNPTSSDVFLVHRQQWDTNSILSC